MEKRYYWLKLQFNFFFDNEVFDYIMRQSDGSRYIVLYQMLCMKTLNNAGELASRIGDIIIPYDTEKIRTECKYFTKSEIICALDLFRRFGLVYEQEDGILWIANFDDMVGSEGASAARVRKYRAAQKELCPGNGQAVGALHCNNDVTQCNVTQPLQERYTAVTSSVTSAKETPPIPPKENREIEIEMTDGLTDNAGDDLKERAKKDTAGACVYASNHKRVDEANLQAYEDYIDQLQWCREDGPTGGMSVDIYDQMIRVMDTIGHEVARRATFRIHDEDIAASEVLDTLTEGMASGNAKATIAALQQVTDKQADGGVGNQLAYLVATLYTRIKQGMVA